MILTTNVTKLYSPAITSIWNVLNTLLTVSSLLTTVLMAEFFFSEKYDGAETVTNIERRAASRDTYAQYYLSNEPFILFQLFP